MYLSPEAERAQFDARAREQAWWPTLQVTRNRVVVRRPGSGARRFADRIKAKHHDLLAYDASRGTWWAPLERIREVYMAFAPHVHLSKGAWVALEDHGATPEGLLVLSPEERDAIGQHRTTVDDILEQARVMLHG